MITIKTGISITQVITQITMQVMKELVDTEAVRVKINKEKAEAITIITREETNTIRATMRADTRARRVIKELNGETR